MRFSTNVPATPTTTTSVELIDNSQGKRGSNPDSIAEFTTSQSTGKLVVNVDEGKDNQQQQQCPQASLQTNGNHHSSPSSPPHLNGVNNIVTQQQPSQSQSDNSTLSNGVVTGDAANQQQIATIDPDRTGEVYSGVSDEKPADTA